MFEIDPNVAPHFLLIKYCSPDFNCNIILLNLFGYRVNNLLKDPADFAN